jgi:TolB-like protein/DNA-binding winged helix-turn-helix (wHTH) protein/cytochrome c-type biogenesis protein CcmH/NrfG
MDKSDTLNFDSPFWVGDWFVNPKTGRIIREGAEVKLEPKAMTVLVLLAQHSGEVLSRQYLEEHAWPGMVVSYDALSSCIIKLRKALDDDSRQPRYIETVSKKGYRLIAPVKSGDEPLHVAEAIHQQYRHKLTMGWTPIIAGVAVLLALFFLRYQLESPSTPDNHPATPGSSEQISLVVLPFANRNDDPKQEYFSDGITDDLINDLSQLSGLHVIARRSAYIYKQRHTDIQTIARELGVNYVLDGDVRRGNNRVRLNVQLIDADTGVNIWAQRFDRQVEDIFQVQDDIRRNIIEALSITLTKEERNRTQRRYTDSFAAYDLFLQGQAKLVTRASARDSHVAQQLMEQAIKLDPNFARAYAALALIHADAFRFDWSEDPEETRQLALQIGKRAVELDPQSPQAQWILGYIYLFLFEEHTKAIEAATRATKLAPSDMDAFTVLAVTYAFGDDPAKARLIIQELMERNPRYSALVPSVLGLANFRLGKLNESLDAYDKSLLINPSRIQGNIYKAVVLYRMGREGDAEFQLDELLTLHPDFNVQVWAARQPFKDKTIIKGMLADLARLGVK